MISVIVPVKGEPPEAVAALARFAAGPEAELVVADGARGSRGARLADIYEMAGRLLVFTALAFRNGPIEDLHAGQICPTCSGKPEYSHITDPEMKAMMMAAVNAMYRLLWQRENDPAAYLRSLELGQRYVHKWADPDPGSIVGR